MKKIIHLVLFLTLIFSHSFSYSQKMTTIDSNTIIKDESGKKITLMKFINLMNSGEWMVDPVNDNNGKPLYVQMRKATKEEKETLSLQLNESSNRLDDFFDNSDLIGKKVPEFKFTDLNGNKISTENTKGKVVVLNFWFAACKPCIAEIPDLNKVYYKYKDNKDVVFASITFDKKEKAESYLKKYAFKYPTVANSIEISRLFNVSSYPTNIVIDKNGNYANLIKGGFPGIGDTISTSIQKAIDSK